MTYGQGKIGRVTLPSIDVIGIKKDFSGEKTKSFDLINEPHFDKTRNCLLSLALGESDNEFVIIFNPAKEDEYCPTPVRATAKSIFYYSK